MNQSNFRFKSLVESLVVHFLSFFPIFVNYLDLYGKENYEYIRETTKNIVLNRTVKRGDFIDRLKELNDDKSKHSLNENMIMSQGIGFFIAGFETGGHP